VGKSSLFNALSRSYTVVSTYPGTSVEVSRRKGRIGDRENEIIDTPGMYSHLPVGEEERVSQRLLFNEKTFVYLHVLDARNLRRMLSFTFQLLEVRLPLNPCLYYFPVCTPYRLYYKHSAQSVGGEPVKCPLCGNEFEKANAPKCTGC
jgi:Fe2+ transport system protein B